MGSQLNADTPLLIANFKTRPHEWGERRTGKVRRYIWQTLQRYEPVPEEKKRKKKHVVCEAQLRKGRAHNNQEKKRGGGVENARRAILWRARCSAASERDRLTLTVCGTQHAFHVPSYFVSNLFLANTEAATPQVRHEMRPITRVLCSREVSITVF